MSKNKLKRKQDKKKKRQESNRQKVLKIKSSSIAEKRLEKQKSRMNREMEKIQAKAYGITIRKPHTKPAENEGETVNES